MAVGKVIYDLLSNDATVSATVGTKIYPDIAPQTTSFPYVVYQEISTTPTDDKDGTSKLDSIRLQIDMYDDNYDDIETLATAIRDALDRQTGTIQSVAVDKIIFSNEVSGNYDIDMNIWWRSQDYDIRIAR